jgi:hypothetical protein
MALCSRRIRAVEEPILAVTKGISKVQLSHAVRAGQARFDDPSLVSAGGLVPVLALAERAGLRALADQHLTVPSDKGANAGWPRLLYRADSLAIDDQCGATQRPKSAASLTVGRRSISIGPEWGSTPISSHATPDRLGPYRN